MEATNHDDELIARIAALQPARGALPLSKRSIRALIRSATATGGHDPATWTWPRYRLATLGALVGSSALVIAGIVGLDAAGTSLQVAASVHETALHPAIPSNGASAVSTATSASPSPVLATSWAATAGCPLTLELGAVTKVSGVPARASAYRIASALTPRGALVALAPHFGLATSHQMWFTTSALAKAWWVGTLEGRSLTTYVARGITWWSYLGPSETTKRRILEAGPHGEHLWSEGSSARAADALLKGLVGHAELGSAVAIRTKTSVAVSIPLSVHGVPTDQRFEVAYDARGRLASASGPLVSVVQAVSYPTITPRAAAQARRRPLGRLVALLPPSSTTAGSSSGASGRPAATLYCDGVAGSQRVSAAMMTLSMKELASGPVWLLPSWTFIGVQPTAKSTYGSDATAASSVAVSPRYLDYEPVVVRHRAHKPAR